MGDVSIPDMGLFANARERAFCMEIASVARENLLSLPEAGGTLSVRLGIFEGQVMALMGVEDDAGAKEIRIAARLGYVVGAMENGSGVEHSEQSEIHYLMALDLVTMTLGNTASFMFEFTSSGGYFLARTRDQGLQPLVYAARGGGGCRASVAGSGYLIPNVTRLACLNPRARFAISPLGEPFARHLGLTRRSSSSRKADRDHD